MRVAVNKKKPGASTLIFALPTLCQLHCHSGPLSCLYSAVSGISLVSATKSFSFQDLVNHLLGLITAAASSITSQRNAKSTVEIHLVQRAVERDGCEFIAPGWMTNARHVPKRILLPVGAPQPAPRPPSPPRPSASLRAGAGEMAAASVGESVRIRVKILRGAEMDFSINTIVTIYPAQ